VNVSDLNPGITATESRLTSDRYTVWDITLTRTSLSNVLKGFCSAQDWHK
jgi:hypothetical protein